MPVSLPLNMWECQANGWGAGFIKHFTLKTYYTLTVNTGLSKGLIFMASLLVSQKVLPLTWNPIKISINSLWCWHSQTFNLKSGIQVNSLLNVKTRASFQTPLIFLCPWLCKFFHREGSHIMANISTTSANSLLKQPDHFQSFDFSTK